VSGRPSGPLRPAAEELLLCGATVAEAAALSGAPVGSVGRWAADLGLARHAGRRPAGAPLPQHLPILEALRAGETPLQVSRRLGVSRSTVRGLARRWLSL